MNRTRKLPPVFQSILGPDVSTETIMDRLKKKSIMDLAWNEQKHYFENSHVFLLAGHGSELGGERYELKPNEFYAIAMQCGRLSSFNPPKKYIDFVTHNPTIKIPDESIPSSLYPLDYPDFPFKQIGSLNQRFYNHYENTGITPNTVEDEFKIYFPQSTFSHTKTIPFAIYHPLAYWKRPRVNYKGNPIPFEFNGKTDNINEGVYDIYMVTISGLLRPNSITDNFKNNFNKLQLKSNYLYENLFPNIQKVNDNELFMIIAEDDNLKIPILKDYNSNILSLVFSLSFFTLQDFIDMDPSFSWDTPFPNPKIRINDLFDNIRIQFNDNKPIFIINSICRYVLNTSKSTRINNLGYESNTGTNRRGTKSRKKFKHVIITKDNIFSSPRKQRFSIINKYLRLGGDPNVTDSNGNSLLSLHISSPDIIKLLLLYGADPNLPNNKKKTPLHHLSKAIEFLLFDRQFDSNTLLNISNRFLEIIDLMFDANFSLKDKDGYSPLHLLIHKIRDSKSPLESYNNTKDVINKLSEYSNFDNRDNNGISIINEIIEIDGTTELLQKKAPGVAHSITAIDIIKAVIKNVTCANILINAKTINQRFPLPPQIINELINYKMKYNNFNLLSIILNIFESEKNTTFDSSKLDDYIKIIDFFVKIGVNPDEVDIYGNTPRQVALSLGIKEISDIFTRNNTNNSSVSSIGGRLLRRRRSRKLRRRLQAKPAL